MVQHNVVQLQVSVDYPQRVEKYEPNLSLEMSYNQSNHLEDEAEANKLTAISAA